MGDANKATVTTPSSEIPSSWTQVSSFQIHPVRFLSIGGGTLCYTWDGEIYLQTPGSQPARLNVTLTLDEENSVEKFSVAGGSSDAAVSPDGNQIAFVTRGEVFVTSVKYKTTRQITHTAAAENSVSFGADSRTIVYSSERTGVPQLYLAKIARDEDPDFPNATLITEEVFLPDQGVERAYPKFSPDGKWFVIEYTANGHEPYNDVGIVSSNGGPITNITASGYMSGGARWVLGGNAILFQSEIYGMRAHASWGSQMDVFLCFVNQDAYDRYRLSKEDYELLKNSDKKAAKADTTKAPKRVSIELEGIRDRVVRLTPNSSDLGDAILSTDGESLKKMDGDRLSSIPVSCDYKVDHYAEREYMYDYVCREEQKRFYKAAVEELLREIDAARK